jgi:hypothetical protein
MEDGKLSFQLAGRYLQGYVTRGFINDQPGFKPTPTYELDMPTPEGLSGAPLFKLGTLDVVGIVYGSNDVGQIVEFASKDADTGELRPEVQRLQTFGLAHETVTLHGVQGSTTRDRRLGELVRVGRSRPEHSGRA